jgi:hypothetical protein
MPLKNNKSKNLKQKIFLLRKHINNTIIFLNLKHGGFWCTQTYSTYSYIFKCRNAWKMIVPQRHFYPWSTCVSLASAFWHPGPHRWSAMPSYVFSCSSCREGGRVQETHSLQGCIDPFPLKSKFHF